MSLDEADALTPAPEGKRPVRPSREEIEKAKGFTLDVIATYLNAFRTYGQSDDDFRDCLLAEWFKANYNERLMAKLAEAPPGKFAYRADVEEPMPPTQPSKGAAELRAQGLTATGQVPGRKDDAGKLRLDLVPWRALESIAAVLTYGAKRYGDDNWHQVLSPNRRYFAAALRHLGAWRLGRASGDTNDPDTGLPHLAHAACCVLFLLSMAVGFDPSLDD